MRRFLFTPVSQSRLDLSSLSSSRLNLPMDTMPWRLLLASGSPRRAQLLEVAGIPFTVVPNTWEEPPPTLEEEGQPEQYVEKLSRAKATACDVAPFDDSHLVVLTADTIVWHDGRILNKPIDVEEARLMLQTLRGREHQVFTGVCLRCIQNASDGETTELLLVEHEATTVRFGMVDDDWIESYIGTGEPLDKAGSYAAQGKGAVLIERIEGDFWNVVGLPLTRLSRMLKSVGAPAESWWKA